MQSYRHIPRIPWERAISAQCALPPWTHHIKSGPQSAWLMLPTNTLVGILQRNCSELLCLWQFWSCIGWSGLEYPAEDGAKELFDSLSLRKRGLAHRWWALIYTRRYERTLKDPSVNNFRKQLTILFYQQTKENDIHIHIDYIFQLGKKQWSHTQYCFWVSEYHQWNVKDLVTTAETLLKLWDSLFKTTNVNVELEEMPVNHQGW